MTLAAIPALSDSTGPAMGMDTTRSHVSRTRRDKPSLRTDDDDDRVVAEIELGQGDVAVHVEADDDEPGLLKTLQSPGEVAYERDRNPLPLLPAEVFHARGHADGPALGHDDPVTAERRDRAQDRTSCAGR